MKLTSLANILTIRSKRMTGSKKPLIIGLVGEIASGKTTATDYLSEKYGAEPYKFSGMLRDILARLRQEATRENLQKLSTAVRQLFGESVMSKVISQDLASATAPLIVAEGIRRLSDIEYLKEFSNFALVAIDADARSRYERITQRSENADDRAKTWDAFVLESQREPEQKIREVMKSAKYVIDNNGPIDDFYAQIDALMARIRNS